MQPPPPRKAQTCPAAKSIKNTGTRPRKRQKSARARGGAAPAAYMNTSFPPTRFLLQKVERFFLEGRGEVSFFECGSICSCYMPAARIVLECENPGRIACKLIFDGKNSSIYKKYRKLASFFFRLLHREFNGGSLICIQSCITGYRM